MPNPFDQFDHLPPSTVPKQKTADEAVHELGTKAGENSNPFDQFDEVPPTVNPMDTFSGPPSMDAPRPDIQNLGDMLGAWRDNLGPSLVNSGVKIAGAFADPIGTANGALDLVGGLAAKALPADWRNTNNPEGQRMNAAADAAIQDYVKAYGSPQAAVNTLGYDPSRVAMDAASLAALTPAPGALRAGLTAARVPGPVIDGLAIAANPARAMEGPAQAAGRITRAGLNATDVRGNTLRRALDGREQEGITALNNAPTYVPGGPPSAAQALTHMADTPATAQILLKEADKLRPNPKQSRVRQQNAQRLAAVDAEIPHPDVEAAIADRAAQAEQDYANAGVVRDLRNPPAHPVANVMIPDNPALQAIAESPSMNHVFDRARSIAAEHRRDFQVGQTTPGGPVATGLVGPNGQPLMVNQPPTVAQFPAQSLHFVKQAYDDLIADPATHGIGAAEVDAIRGTREDFINWFEAHNPAYGVARRNYRDASIPIDQSTLMTYYRNKLTGLVAGDDAAKLNANAFALARSNAMNEATFNSSIKKATGEPRYRHDAQVLTPEQLRALDNVGDDLGRAKVAEEQASTPNTISDEINNAATAFQLPGFLNHLVTGFNYLTRAGTGQVNRAVANSLADAAQNPAELAALVQRALDRETQLNGLSRPIQDIGRGVQGVNRVPAVYNALAAERDNRHKRESIEEENKRLRNSL